MAKEELAGNDLKRRFQNVNAHRVIAGEKMILQKDLAKELGVSPVSISNAFAGWEGLGSLRKRIAEYIASIEQGSKPLPNRMYAKPLATR